MYINSCSELQHNLIDLFVDVIKYYTSEMSVMLLVYGYIVHYMIKCEFY